jgi:uncharacterized protein (DUF302 family)
MKRMSAFLGTLMAMVILIGSASANEVALKTYSLQGDYADVVQDVEDGIVNAGLNIDYRGKISAMLDRTGKDIGATKKVYKGAEFMQFCSARLSREMMEADASNMGVCPYIVFVYETVAKPGTITVGYKRPLGAAGDASQKALGKIEALLDGIVKEAAGK